MLLNLYLSLNLKKIIVWLKCVVWKMLRFLSKQFSDYRLRIRLCFFCFFCYFFHFESIKVRSICSQMSFKIVVFKNFTILKKTSVLESLYNKVAGLQTHAFIKKRLQHTCFSINIAKFLRTNFFIENLR